MADEQDFADSINNMPGEGWVRAMGLRVTRATVDEVACEWEVGANHLQGYGIVHGGVYCGVIETLASIGAHLVATGRGQRTVGLENHTSFVRAVRGGRLRGVARPVTRGRSSQLWEARSATTRTRSSPAGPCACCASRRTAPSEGDATFESAAGPRRP